MLVLATKSLIAASAIISLAAAAPPTARKAARVGAKVGAQSGGATGTAEAGSAAGASGVAGGGLLTNTLFLAALGGVAATGAIIAVAAGDDDRPVSPAS